MSASGPAAEHHKVLVVGGGTAGITVAARLVRAGIDDIAVVEPSGSHYYQPLWTLVGGGRASADETVRPEADVMPKGVRWVREAATDVDPEAQTVTTESGRTHYYDYLVMAPGIQLNFGNVPGLTEPSAAAASPVTTGSTSRHAPGRTSATCAAAPRCSRCPRDRSSARAPLRRSLIWPPTGGGHRASWTAPG